MFRSVLKLCTVPVWVEVVVQEIVIQGGMEQGDHFDDEIYQKRWNKDVDVGHAPIVMNR